MSSTRATPSAPRSELHLIGGVAEEALREPRQRPRSSAWRKPTSVRTPATTYSARRRRTFAACLPTASRPIGISVPAMICTTIWEMNSRVCTMKSSVLNDSSAS